jgi:hypothetical protein
VASPSGPAARSVRRPLLREAITRLLVGDVRGVRDTYSDRRRVRGRTLPTYDVSSQVRSRSRGAVPRDAARRARAAYERCSRGADTWRAGDACALPQAGGELVRPDGTPRRGRAHRTRRALRARASVRPMRSGSRARSPRRTSASCSPTGAAALFAPSVHTIARSAHTVGRRESAAHGAAPLDAARGRSVVMTMQRGPLQPRVAHAPGRRLTE